MLDMDANERELKKINAKKYLTFASLYENVYEKSRLIEEAE